MFHIAQRVKGKGPYMENLNSTLLRHFLEGIGSTKKQNRGPLVGSRVYATTVLNQTISSEELSRYITGMFVNFIYFLNLFPPNCPKYAKGWLLNPFSFLSQ